jgi:hypothetical protein
MLLYAIYTLWVAVLLEHNIEIYIGYRKDLVQLGASIAEGSTFFSGARSPDLGVIGTQLEKLSAVLMFLSCNAYLVYSYLKENRLSCK